MNNRFAALATLYRNELRERLLPFWKEMPIDEQFGGYFNWVSSNGDIIQTDKHLVWQAKQIITFLAIHKKIDPNTHWLDLAQHGIDFLEKTTLKNIPSVVDRTGRTVKKSEDSSTEAWIACAYVKFGQATNQPEYADKAQKLFIKTLKQREKTHQKQLSGVQSERYLKNIQEVTALARALNYCKDNLSEALFKNTANDLVEELTTHFWDNRAEVLLSNVPISGGFSDCLEGRRIGPKAVFEAIAAFWELAKTLKNRKLQVQLASQCTFIAKTTWDDLYGGYMNYLDIKGSEAIDCQMEMKAIASQVYALWALLLINPQKKESEPNQFFQRTHDYVWQYFSDTPNQNEWHEQLSRHGEPLLNTWATPDKSAYETVYCFISILEQLEMT